MKLYKLTNQNNTSNVSEMCWGEGITNKLKKVPNPRLCSMDVIHAYKNINLAFLLNPVHGGYKNPKVWEAKGKVVVEDWGKVGCFELITIRELKIPKWVGSSYEQNIRVQFAVLCAESVLCLYENKYPKDNRVKKAIESAKEYLKNNADAVHAAATDAAHAAYVAAADAAYAAAAYAVSDTDRATAYAVHAAYIAAYAAAAYAAAAYADAAYAAAYAVHAARAAVHAAHAAAAGDIIKIDFGELADEAVELIKKNE